MINWDAGTNSHFITRDWWLSSKIWTNCTSTNKLSQKTTLSQLFSTTSVRYFLLNICIWSLVCNHSQTGHQGAVTPSVKQSISQLPQYVSQDLAYTNYPNIYIWITNIRIIWEALVWEGYFIWRLWPCFIHTCCVVLFNGWLLPTIIFVLSARNRIEFF